MRKLSRTLGILGNAYPLLWSDFVRSENDALLITQAISRFVTLFEGTLDALTKHKESKIPQEQYMGYDIRDIKDFNMEGYHHEEVEDTALLSLQTDLMTILLILHQIFAHKSDIMSNLINNNGHCSSILKSKLSNSVEAILHLLAKKLEEEFYLEIIRIVALINGHFSPSIAENRTEVFHCCFVFVKKNVSNIFLLFYFYY